MTKIKWWKDPAVVVIALSLAFLIVTLTAINLTVNLLYGP